MGADMTLFCAPACKLTPSRLEQIEQVVRMIPNDDESLTELMEQLNYDDATEAKERTLDGCRAAQEESREIVTLRIPGCPYQVRAAGGLSWGDPPSEGYTALEHIERCPQVWQLLENFARQDVVGTREDPTGMAAWRVKRRNVTVAMTSDECGHEHFHNDSIADALAAVERLVHQAESQADSIERLIGIVVNPSELYGDPLHGDDDQDG